MPYQMFRVTVSGILYQFKHLKIHLHIKKLNHDKHIEPPQTFDEWCKRDKLNVKKGEKDIKGERNRERERRRERGR